MTAATPTMGRVGQPLARAGAVALLAVAAMLVVFHEAYRTWEIRLSGVVIDLVTSSGVHVAPHRQTVYFGLGTDHAIGLKITPECTSAFLVVPLVVAAAAMVALRPRITRRVLVSLAVGVVVLIVVNQLRMLTLVGLIDGFGRERGYYLGHTLFGSMVSVFGGAIALVLFVWLATRVKDRSTDGPPAPPDEDRPRATGAHRR